MRFPTASVLRVFAAPTEEEQSYTLVCRVVLKYAEVNLPVLLLVAGRPEAFLFTLGGFDGFPTPGVLGSDLGVAGKSLCRTFD